jgi:hypothetical protein
MDETAGAFLIEERAAAGLIVGLCVADHTGTPSTTAQAYAWHIIRHPFPMAA